MPNERPDITDNQRAKVVLVRIEKEKDRYEVAKVLAAQLGVSFEEAGELIEDLPLELIPSIPVEAGEQFAEKLRQVGAEVEVLPIGRAAGRFCYRHPHRRARAKCKEPGCEHYICEICLIEAKGRLFCLEHYHAYRRRRVLIALATLTGMFMAIYMWMAYGYAVKRWFNFMYVDTARAAVVLTSRKMDEATGAYYMRMSTTETPGAYREGDAHTLPDIETWFQREFARAAQGEIDIMELDVYGLYELTGEVPHPSRSAKLTFRSFRANHGFKRFFNELGKTNNLDLNAYDAVLFVELAADSGVENDYMEQLGFVFENTGYMRLPIAGQFSNDYYVMAVAFYVARLLGAQPHLDIHGFPEPPAGFAEPMLQPRYPQSKAELMGCYIPQRPFEIRRIHSLDSVVIGPETAYELGWISRAERNNAYSSVAP